MSCPCDGEYQHCTRCGVVVCYRGVPDEFRNRKWPDIWCPVCDRLPVEVA